MKLKIALLIAALVLVFTGLKVYGDIKAPDKQCSTAHTTTSKPVPSPVTASDYFETANYYYDIGNCDEAIANYTRSIEIDLNYPQAYNNRAYTNMRMQNYQDALTDLDKAIELKPDYIEAIMNRADIHNYYFQIDRQRAIKDYDKVIALGKEKDKSNSACGHKSMAETNNFLPLAFLKYFLGVSC